MRIDHTAELLDSPNAWTNLAQALGGENSGLVLNILRHLRVLGAKSFVVEDPYIDRDYSTDYLHFYARTFRTHDRHCKRVHFFSDDITPLLRRPLSTQRLHNIRSFASEAYCGFCVIRPLSTAPIGRTILTAKIRNGFDMEATVTCRAAFDAHLLGVDLKVTVCPSENRQRLRLGLTTGTSTPFPG